MHSHGPAPPPAGSAAPERSGVEVAEIFRVHGGEYRRTHALSGHQRAVMHAIETCRTAVRGGHRDVCPACGEVRISYNSCRDRHCPKCQTLAQVKWVVERQARILPVAHFHVVFTVPDALRPVAAAHPARFYELLFRAASATLLALCADPGRLGAQPGITAVLHTWTRDLRLHPHLHCIVTGGGLSRDGTRWIAARQRYLLPAKVVSRLFRGKLVAALEEAHAAGELSCAATADFARLRRRLFAKEWVVYAKRPFGGAQAVFSYLGRYTHRVAISNRRLLSMDGRGVRFLVRGSKIATLAPQDFIGRFLQHVLPEGFVKIRHYGLLAAGNVNTRLAAARRLLDGRHPLPGPVLVALALFVALWRPPSEQLGWRERLLLLTGVDPLRCPRCGHTMQRLPLAAPAAPDTS